MFNEREMSKAIDWLFELFSPEDYEGYDEDEIGYAGGLCLPEVCTALRGAAQTVYQYSVAGGYEKCFNYRGMELFDQRACLIISDVEQAVLDEIKTTYETELWLMEDMNFAIVRCVSMLIGSDDQALGKETIDTYNTSNTRGNSPSYGMNYQKLGKDLATVDELAVLDGGKCILQLRGVRPFLSDKYDLTQHPNYKYTSDFDKKNEFNIEQFLSRRLKLKAGDEFVVVDAD